MGLLDSFERGLERAVNGAFAKTFRSGVQPVEIASALRRETDTKAAVVSRDRILAPNALQVRLSPTDASRMRALGTTLENELLETVRKHAKRQGYSFAGPVSVTVDADETIPTGVVQVDSATTEARSVTWNAVLDIDGQRHMITKSRTVIGRGSDADITVNDANTSRRHVEVIWDGKHAMMRDLGSTNGSKLNGDTVSSGPLEPDSTITIGRTNIVFRVVAQQAQPTQPRRTEPATRIFNAEEFGR